MNKEMVKEKLHNNLGVIGLIIVIAFFEIVNGGQLITTRSINSLINELFAMALATSGLVFLLAQNCLDFSASGLIVLSAAVAARAGAISPYLVLPVAILTGLLLGLCNGFLHAVCKIGFLYLQRRGNLSSGTRFIDNSDGDAFLGFQNTSNHCHVDFYDWRIYSV